MYRVYEKLIEDDYAHHQQMVLLAGPRQVGKTTISQHMKNIKADFFYFNWDVQGHRRLIIRGAEAVAESIQLTHLRKYKPIIVFDEIHKYGRWKSFLKGFYDSYKKDIFIIVIGSSKLDVFKKGSDSLMGRYFLYRIHPITVAEYTQHKLTTQEIRPPKIIPEITWKKLYDFGGFPEPFLNAHQKFTHRWQQLRQQQLFHEDIRDLSRVQELAQVEILAQMIKAQAGQMVVYTNLATEINVSVDTVKRWIIMLENFYYCFTIKPWFKNVSRSLRKQPKIYLWDWSTIDDEGMKAENFIASHLLKATHFWTDIGLGQFGLFYLRDKEQHEVDFVVTKNHRPWFIVEVKQSADAKLSKNLLIFQKQIQAAHAFQVAIDMPYINKDCFQLTVPTIVPARTLLSQFV